MSGPQVTVGPIRDSDVEIDPEIARKLRPRIRHLSPEEYDKMRRTVIYRSRSK